MGSLLESQSESGDMEDGPHSPPFQECSKPKHPTILPWALKWLLVLQREAPGCEAENV